jgi:hypothetical protein
LSCGEVNGDGIAAEDAIEELLLLNVPAKRIRHPIAPSKAGGQRASHDEDVYGWIVHLALLPRLAKAGILALLNICHH